MVTFREGDIVIIEATIASKPFAMDNGKVQVKIKFPPYHDAYVDPAQLTMKRPAFEVGDEIAWAVGEEGAGHGYRGRVLSIANDHLWVDMGLGHYATVWTGKASRVEMEPQPDFDEVEEAPPPPPVADTVEGD